MKRSYGSTMITSSSHSEPPSLEQTKQAIEKRLFIGSVPQGTTEAELRDTFGMFGAVTECKVIDFKGVAFVGFDCWGAAHRALEATDNKACLQNSPGTALSVSFAERSGAGRGVGAAYSKGLEHNRVFVGGLPEDMADHELRTIFEPYGQVIGANLLASKAGRGRCGFVNFSLWGEALDAIEALHNQRYPLHPGSELLTVVLASPRDGDSAPSFKSMRREDSYAAPSMTLSNLSPMGMGTSGSSEYEQLKAMYLAAVDGDTPADICDDLHRKIMAARPAVAARLAAAGFGNLSGGSGISMSYSEPQSLPRRSSSVVASPQGLSSSVGQQVEERDAARLFVGGLPFECSDEELRALVGQLPFQAPSCQLLECRVLPSRGCGYLRFSSWDAAAEAMQALDERAVSGWAKPLNVKWATPKSQSGGGGGGGGGHGGNGAAHSSIASAAAAAGNALAALGGSAGGSLDGLLGQVQQLLQSPGIGSSSDEATMHAQGLDPKRLFIGQLTRDLHDQNILLQLFEPFGKVEELKFLQDKGVAYVRFQEHISAKLAQETLNSKQLPGITTPSGLNVTFSRMR